ncbi:YSC84-related protein [Algoriphagus aquatilis]|uniref:YSC84-related protein n=1 Tax=Algoriphagus aquatilis TaxID=490186 RepID=A0ABW0BXH4_9BACT
MKNLFLLLVFTLFSVVAFPQDDEKDEKIMADSEDAKAAFIKDDSGMADFFADSFGYIILPNVGKGAWGVGAAAGNGVVFENGKHIGFARMTQLTIGFQAGGQAYSEVVFFETKEAFERFKEGKVEMSAQVSAVAAASGASANAKYNEGVLVFTRTKKGLMYEASVGGQQFKFRAK